MHKLFVKGIFVIDKQWASNGINGLSFEMIVYLTCGKINVNNKQNTSVGISRAIVCWRY